MIDDSCSIEMAVSSIIVSKTFDNGVICASEQSVVVMDNVYAKVRAEFQKRGAYFLSEDEKVKVSGGWGGGGGGLGVHRHTAQSTHTHTQRTQRTNTNCVLCVTLTLTQYSALGKTAGRHIVLV